MRKVAFPVAALTALLVMASVAFAAQVNKYTVTAGTSPSSAGSKAKPKSVGVKFNYTVDEAAGQRPSVITTYSIFFDGLVAANKLKATCTAAQINAAKTNKGCSTAAKVGTGDIDAKVGATNNPADQSLSCHLYLTLYNGGKDKLTLYLNGGPSGFAKPCVTPQSMAIAATTVKQGSGSALKFSVPAGLLHPLGGPDGLTSAVRVTSSNIKAGFYQSVGGCKGGKRKISVTFTPESGSKTVQNTTAKCSA